MSGRDGGNAGDVFQVQIGRDVIEATGPDTVAFLQGQLSQDVAQLGEGESAYSLLLQPQGKIDAWVRVTRRHADTFILDVDAGWGEAVVTRLNRFKLRTKCELSVLEDWQCWAVRGLSPHEVGARAEDGPAVIVSEAAWPGSEGFDRFGPALEALEGIALGTSEQYVAARLAAGVPAMGHELDEHIIPAEAGAWLINQSVSFTKGCYTGQELVARVDSRGSNTPRRLRSVRSEGGMRTGAALQIEGVAVGTITSVTDDGTLALAYVKRSVEPPAVAQLDDVAVRIERVPED